MSYLESGRVLIIHDNPDLANTFAESYTLLKGIPTEAYTTAREANNYIRKSGGVINAIVVHKDLGDISGEGHNMVESVVKTAREVNEMIRVIIISGEYPNGEKHVLLLGADGYIPTRAIGENWVMEQIKKGPVKPDEINMRHTRVAKP